MAQMSGVRLAERQEKEIQKYIDMGLYISVSEFIREAVREKIESMKVIDVRKVNYKQAKKEVLDFLSENKEAYASDISESLRLDIDLIFKILKDLKKEGRIE